MKSFMAIFIVIWVSLGVASLWVGGSVITSAIKAGTEQCDKTYGIESVLSGDWFCPDEE